VEYKEDKMRRRHLFTLGIVLILVTLLTTACAFTTPKNITITFDETCTMDGPKTVPVNKYTTIDIIGNNTKHNEVGLAIYKLDHDKTMKDLQDWQSTSQLTWTQPPWSQKVGFYQFPSDGSSYPLEFYFVAGPIYFVRLYEDVEEPIGVLRTVDVVN
jgi:hypothetical protein